MNNINRYENVRYRNAIVGIDGDRFGRGRNQFVRVAPDRVRDMRPVRGELGVRPVSASLVAREGRGVRPPDRIQNRQVVATRPPQDPARLPRSNGLVRTDDARRRPEPRIVAPRGESTNRLERGRDRTMPPPRGGTDRDAVERTRGERGGDGTRGRDVRGHDDTRGRDATERVRGVERVPSAEGGVERVPGDERGGSRRAPEPPPGSERQPNERDRNGRDVGTSVERRGVDREPTPPRGGGEEPTRRVRGNDDVPVPPRGGDRVEQPARDRARGSEDAGRQDRVRQPEPPRTDREVRPPRNERDDTAPEAQSPRGRDRGNDRSQQIEQPRMESPRMEQPQRQPRMEQPREQPRMESPSRNERPPTRDSGGSSHESFQRQPTMRQEAPRPQRQEMPRMEQSHGGGSPRGGGDPRGGSGDQRGGGNSGSGSGGHGGGSRQRGHDQ